MNKRNLPRRPYRKFKTCYQKTLCKLHKKRLFCYCSGFRYESNGIFVLGVGFFLQTNFDFLTSNFWRNFLKIIRKLLFSWAWIWKDILPVIIFHKVLNMTFDHFYLWSFFFVLNMTRGGGGVFLHKISNFF